MRGEGEVNPCTDLPLRADRGNLSLRGAAEAIPFFVGATLASHCVPGCKGEASGMICAGSPVMPFPDASPLQNTEVLPRPYRMVRRSNTPTQSPCHCEAQPKQSLFM